jgi:hypothetical protein
MDPLEALTEVAFLRGLLRGDLHCHSDWSDVDRLLGWTRRGRR